MIRRILLALALVGLTLSSAAAEVKSPGNPTALSGTITGTYTLGGTPTITGLAGVNGWTPTFAARGDNPIVVAGGANYVVGDTVTLNTTGGTCTTTPVVSVSTITGSAIATPTVLIAGVCSSWPTQPMTQASSSGTGTGATFTLTPTPTILSTGLPKYFSGPAHNAGTNNWIINGSTIPNQSATYLNLAFGPNSQAVNVNGAENLSIGAYSLQSYTGGATPAACGAGNVAIGINSQGLNVSGCTNVSLGSDSQAALTASNDNVAVGAGAQGGEDIGAANIAIGSGAETHGTSARTQTVAIGHHALFGQTSVSAYSRMTVAGYNAVAGATLGSPARDVIFGDNAANGSAFAGTDDVILGSFTGNKLTGAASTLTILGSASAINATTPSHSILIGDSIAGTNFLTASHQITICTLGSACDDNTSNELNIENMILATGTNTNTTASLTLHGSGLTVPDITTGTNADVLCVDASKIVRLQAAASCTISSMRFKRDIEPISDRDALRTVMQLQPAQFYLKDGDKNPDANAARLQVSLMAEDVDRVDPRLALYEPDMKTPKSWRLEGMIAELVGAVQAQQRQIDRIERREMYFR